MAKNLVIVESPTKSKTIEKFLGKTYTVCASMGHLRDLPKSQFGVDIEKGFEPKYINIRGKGDLIKNLRNLAKKADNIFLATDPDREGEAIAWHLAHLLEVDPAKKCRIEFHEITPGAIKDAFKHPQAIDMDKVDAQQARRILDRIVGYKLSPLLWRKVRKGLSAGRVQSVAVKIICDRQKEIDAFVPEEFWTIDIDLKEQGKVTAFEANAYKYDDQPLKISNEQEAKKVEDDLKAAKYSVISNTQKEKIRKPFPPFTTSSLQQEAVKKLNFTTKKTMMVAQQLYEGVNLGREGSVGLITYMRTDSVRLADSAVAEMREYIGMNFGERYLPETANVFSSKKNAQDAHEAIRPTSVLRTPDSVDKFLTKDQYRLYSLIWKRALASQMANAVSEVTNILINAGRYELRSTGSTIKFEGFLRLSDKKDFEEEKTRKLPRLRVGAQLEIAKFKPAQQHFTEPPANFTEATLVKELEDKGIGRPSTYSPTIQTILTRGYIGKEGKKLLPTELGVLTNEFLTEYFPKFIDIPFSAKLEGDLDHIAEEHQDKEIVLAEFYGDFLKSLEAAEVANPPEEIPPEISDVKCEKCGRLMVVKQGRYGKFLACPGFPECRNAKPILNKIGVTCPECGGDVIERKSKTRRIFYGCSNYPTCKFTSWDKPLNSVCPKCGHIQMERVDRLGKKTVHCSNPECELSNTKKSK